MAESKTGLENTENITSSEVPLERLYLTEEDIPEGDIPVHPRIITLPYGVRMDVNHGVAVFGEVNELCKKYTQSLIDREQDLKKQRELRHLLSVAKKCGYFWRPQLGLKYINGFIPGTKEEICLSVCDVGEMKSYSAEPRNWEPQEYPSLSEEKFLSYSVKVRYNPDTNCINDADAFLFKGHNMSSASSRGKIINGWVRQWARLYQNRLLSLSFGK